MVSERIILGIDPGTIVMGYAVLRIVRQDVKILNFGTICLNKLEDHYIRLKHIYEATIRLIETYAPDELAIEAPFYGSNVQSMLKLGRSQGTVILAALQYGLPITEYVPKRIKQAITGNGSASKEQVAGMLQRYLKIPQDDMPKELDATDALATALCHHFLTSAASRLQNKGAAKTWSDFVKLNPERIKR